MIALVALASVIALAAVAVRFLGIGQQRDGSPSARTQISLDAAEARRRIHEVDSTAFTSMANQSVGRSNEPNRPGGLDR